MGGMLGPVGGLDEDPYIPPAVVHGRQRRALQAVGSMDLSPEELQILRRMAEISGHPVKEEKGVMERMKGLFG